MEEGGLLDMSINIILSLIIPPAAVYRQQGFDDSFWLCVLLTLLVVVPGQIYALVVTFINRNHPRKTSKTTIAEADRIMLPKPQRKIAVTPNYMENSSESDLRSILSHSSQEPSVKIEMSEVKNADLPPPPGITVPATRDKRSR